MIRTYGTHQALRRPCSPWTGSTSTCARATSTASSAPTARGRPRRCGCCSGSCSPPRARSRCSASRCPAAGRDGAPAGRQRWWRGRPRTPHLTGRANLALFDAMGGSPGGRRDRRAPASTTSLEQVGLAAPPTAGCAATPSACANGSVWPPRCCARRGCWCSTSPPTAWTRRGSARCATCCSASTPTGTTIFLSSHLLAEVEQLCTPGRRARPRAAGRAGRPRRPCRARPAAPSSRTADPVAAHALLDGRVEHRDGDRLVVPSPTRGEVNALLVGAGVRVTELVRRTPRPGAGRPRRDRGLG